MDLPRDVQVNTSRDAITFDDIVALVKRIEDERPKHAITCHPASSPTVTTAVDMLRSEGHDIQVLTNQWIDPGVAYVVDVGRLTELIERPNEVTAKLLERAGALRTRSPFVMITAT